MLIKKIRIFLRGLGAMPALLFLAAIVLTPPAAAQSTGGGASLGYIPGSSHKLYQINGDCDWVQWDATIGNATPTCNPTVSQTATKADVLGDDVPVAFEHNGELIVTFGDTIGAAGYSTWINVQNSFGWGAHDPIARSTTTNAADGLLLNFFLNGNHGLEILPPPQPNGTAVDMGIDNIPHAGVSLNGTIYLGIKTGNVSLGDGDNDQSHDYSVLATFDETTETFTSGRTISTLPNGHFVGPTFYLAPAGVLGTPPPVSPEPVMLVFGVGAFRASNIYLSIIPSTEFASGVDQNGDSATRYFSAMSNGQPIWSSSESSAAPIVTDLDPANPTISNVSVFYSQPLGLWLMVYDGGRGSFSTEGIYFTYAPQPWGPWSTPQLVFNGCRDKGFGNFIFYYYATAAQNSCPSAMPAGVTSAPNSAGPAGPTIGNQTVNDPKTTRGAVYAPTFVERFTIISGSTLKLFYMFATWNPYAVVMMESDFNITQVNLRTPTSPIPTSSPTPRDTTPTASATATKTLAPTPTFTLAPTITPAVTPTPSPNAASGAFPPSFFAMSAVKGEYPKVTIGTLAHQEFAWARIEQSKGNFNFQLFDNYMTGVQQHGLVDPITNTANMAMTLAAGTPGWAVADQSTCSGTNIVECTAPPDNIQDWADFLTALIEHYNGATQPHIRYYELWNEFNVSLWWTGTDAQMLALAQVAYPIIHQDPYAMLLTPSVAGPVGTASPRSGVTWMTSYLQAGGWQYADGGAFHGYMGAQSGVNPFPMPEDDSTVGCKPFITCYGSIVTKATQMRAVFDQNGLAGKPMFQTEGSWGNNTVTDPDTQVAWLARYNLLQAGLRSTLNLQMAAWFTWADPAFGWGDIATASLEPTAAGLAYNQVYNWVAGSTMSQPCSSAADGTWTCAIERPGGYSALAIWNTQGSTSYTPGTAYTDYRDLAGDTAQITQGASVTIGAKPILLETPGCVGDCNNDGQVTVDEVLTMVNIALGNMQVTACEAGDANHDGQITVDEILAAVNHALNGCAAFSLTFGAHPPLR